MPTENGKVPLLLIVVDDADGGVKDEDDGPESELAVRACDGEERQHLVRLVYRWGKTLQATRTGYL